MNDISNDLHRINSNGDCVIYKLRDSSSVSKLIASTPSTRSILNDPFVVGVDYTNQMRRACGKILSTLAQSRFSRLSESETLVLNILRGGLNFGVFQRSSRLLATDSRFGGRRPLIRRVFTRTVSEARSR